MFDKGRNFMTKAENYNYSNDLINGYHERKTVEKHLDERSNYQRRGFNASYSYY